MAKMAQFLHLQLMTKKKSFSVWAKYLCASKKYYLVFSENAKGYWIFGCH